MSKYGLEQECCNEMFYTWRYKKKLDSEKAVELPLVGRDLNKLFYIVETCLNDSYVLLISVIYLCFSLDPLI